jgi:hypothetical protein
MRKWILGGGVILLGLGCAISDGQELSGGGGTEPELHPGLDARLTLSKPEPQIWKAGVGEGFRAGTHQAGFSLGLALGMHRWIKSSPSHDMVLGAVRYGRVITDLVGQGHWFQGNFELLGEGFGGEQYYPHTAFLGGGLGILRYDFMTGTRLVPYLQIGGGCLWTDIRRPALGTDFEFTEQGGPGINYFLCRNLALTTEYRFMHISNAGIKKPNGGVNASIIYAGMSWYF